MSKMKKLRKRILNRIDPNFAANNRAKTSKRLDLVAAQVADSFHLAGFNGKHPLHGKTVLEIGSGWVLSHSLIFWVLGAKKCVATDLNVLAKPKALSHSVNEASTSMVRDNLAPFEDHYILRERVNQLKNMDYSWDSLKKIGIEYEAPINLTTTLLKDKFDFIYSNSVLEHVPVDDAQKLISNLALMLNPGGIMIHRIHMEDHRNPEARPFDFLGDKDFTPRLQSETGNRIRKSKWMEIFNSIDGLETKVLFEFNRPKEKLPAHIDEAVQYTDENDLRVVNLGLYSVKKG
jgi:SAM-dependent methyltransferase